jgi:DNA-3-methyladenine glycosylase
MEQRRELSHTSRSFCSGPGSLSKALGIHYSHSGTSLTGNKIWLSDEGITIPESQIACSSRIGVEYAGADAALPYRFFIDPDMFK